MTEITAPYNTVIYTIEKAIKEYRKFGHKNIRKIAHDLTVDQGLILILMDQNPELCQKEIAELIFKDYASMTRMVELMVQKKYLNRSINTKDRRKFSLTISPKGQQVIKKLIPAVKENRKKALDGLTSKEINQLNNSLKKIISNCSV
jgi:DNA-binding MarR family transcriptional regulator